MPRGSEESESDDVPESISLSESKKNSERLESERKHAQVVQRTATKNKNREKDRKLKERAAAKKRRGDYTIDTERTVQKASRDEDKGPGGDLEQRMHRAMQEAEDEEESESDYGEEFKGIILPNDDDHDSVDDHEPRNAHYLPDELFEAAFKSSSKRKVVENEAPLTQPEKKKRKSKKDGDIVVGSRQIRILQNPSTPSIPSTTPSEKMSKFLDRTLALKDSKHKLLNRGWERRPVNIGVLRRDGAPISFVRNR